MAEPTDPRIIDMMRQKARNERPLPKDFQELMEKTLEGDPASIRLVQESFSTEGMTAQEYASDWLGRNQSTPEQKVLGNLALSDPSGMTPEQKAMRQFGFETDYIPPYEKMTPEQKVLGNLPLSDPSGMTPEQKNMQDQVVNPGIVEDEMTKILKSLLKASEQKAKDEQQ